GCGRSGDAEFARFCSIAMGSASEVEYHLLLAKDLEILNTADCQDLNGRATEVKRMLTALIQKLNTDRWSLSAAKSFKYFSLSLAALVLTHRN
ncbi:MAG: four helix bundle protein, partial [Bryobacterales bacterium]|nr:four helix bundle protein [Bryobacterales bacterium]